MCRGVHGQCRGTGLLPRPLPVATVHGPRGVVTTANRLGSLARDLLAYSWERRLEHASKARATRVADGLPLEDIGGKQCRGAAGIAYRTSCSERKASTAAFALSGRYIAQRERCSQTGLQTPTHQRSWRRCRLSAWKQSGAAGSGLDVPALQVTLKELRGTVVTPAGRSR